MHQSDSPLSPQRTEPNPTPDLLPSPRACPAGHGSRWLGEGFRLFRQDPWVWILNIIIFLVIMIILGTIPILSLVSSLVGPVFMGGLILGCRDQDRGRPLEVAHVFAGFREQTGRLVAVGALNLLATILIFVVAMALMMTFGMGQDMLTAMQGLENGAMAPGAVPPDAVGMLLMLLVVALVAIPVAMLFWFAPALVVLHPALGVTEALGLSFRGCLRNVLPFLIYGLVLFVLAILASIPFMLGWLVLWPVLIGSIYASYKDIFLAGEG